MRITRRTVLRFGLVGAGVLAVAGVGLGLRATVPRVPRAPLVILTDAEYAVLSAIANRIDPGGEGLPRATDLSVPEKIDALLAARDPRDAEDFRRVLWLVENALAGAIFDRRFTTFTGSPPEVQDATLAAMRDSGLRVRRQAFHALKGLCSAAYWSDPATWAHQGYAGPPDFGNTR